MNFTNITNNKRPKIPECVTNKIVIYHVFDEQKILTYDDLNYGILSNVTPGWWVDLVLYENTGNAHYLEKAKKYTTPNEMFLFFPELLLNVNQQRHFEEILNKLEYSGNIIVKTDSPFIIQTASNDIKSKTIVL